MLIGSPGKKCVCPAGSGELSVEIVGDQVWGVYLRDVKCDCLVLRPGVDLPSIALIVLHSFVGSVL